MGIPMVRFAQYMDFQLSPSLFRVGTAFIKSDLRSSPSSLVTRILFPRSRFMRCAIPKGYSSWRILQARTCKSSARFRGLTSGINCSVFGMQQEVCCNPCMTRVHYWMFRARLRPFAPEMRINSAGCSGSELVPRC